MEALTVMIPARNVATTVERAIASVARALPRDGRILVVDDASEDDTAAVVQRVARRDRRVGLLDVGGRRLGVTGAANALLDAAETPLVARMDADDVSLPWRFRSQLSLMRRHDLDLVFSPALFVGPGRFAAAPQPLLGANPRSLSYELLLNCAVMQPSLTGRRSAILDAGGYRTVPAEDWDLWMRLALNGTRMGRTSLPSVAYRRHAAQTSSQESYKQAVAADAPTAQVHRDLCRSTFGREYRAYSALTGPGAPPDEVADAEQLIDDVAERAADFPPAERISIRSTAHGLRLRLRGRYPTV
ncbi:glycosyltransferase family 2 protein [Williamsia sp.]|uniref:glycosyltransferase family 2 protein n=1 Tax=Williamsia sp. TaxID=1872085 RepID=UPI001A2A85D4|nr:glycosyltransferase family 2 protein [Williamsia sp.]MBJ7288343.1 glycosyltransferase family 2 protein [Williamsia sp.]